MSWSRAASCWSTATSSSAPSTAGCARRSCPARRAVGGACGPGREAPAAPWCSDPGWRSVVGVHRLGDLDEAESGELLERAGVASAARPQLVRLRRGHPPAMALLADNTLTRPLPPP